MTPPTPEELLRLARKVWPGLRVSAVVTHKYAAIEVDYPSSHGRLLSVEGVERAPAALHAALLVLAGELDVAALVAERDRLRDKMRALCRHSDDMHQSWAIAAGTALGDNPDDSYLGGQRAILRIYADSFRKLLPKEG